MSGIRPDSAGTPAWPDFPGLAAPELTPPVRRFLLCLRQVPLLAWIEVSMSAAHADTDADVAHRAGLDARLELERVTGGMPRTVRCVKSRVEFLSSVAKGFAGPAHVAAMTDVALAAALALAVRTKLSDADFTLLYAPFATLIPLDEVRRS